jgi:hypothetical protein
MSYAAMPAPAGRRQRRDAGLRVRRLEHGTLLSIDDFNVDDLMNYVLARMNMKDDSNAKPQFVQLQTNSFISSINAQVVALTGVNPNLKRLPMSTDSVGSAS